MKIKLKNNESFRPFTLEITFENELEFGQFKEIFENGDEKLNTLLVNKLDDTNNKWVNDLADMLGEI